MSYRYSILIFLFAGLSVVGQSKSDRDKIKDLFSKSQKVYTNNPAYKMNVSYKLYRNYKSATISEKYDGIVLKKNDSYYSKIDQTEFLKTKDIFIKIDNQSKLMAIDKDDQSNQPEAIYQLEKLMANFEKFELSEANGEWVCTLTGAKVTFIPYGRIIIYINKQDNSISKEVLFLLQKNEYKDSKGNVAAAYPRLEIAFSAFSLKNIEFGSKLSVSEYIQEKNKKMVPAQKYKAYKIVD